MKPVRNASDPAQVERNRKEIAKRSKRDRSDLLRLLEIPEFRRFAWRYLGFSKLFETSFTGNSTTFFNEGMRSVGLKLLHEITTTDPAAYLKMMNEARDSELEHDNEEDEN